VLRDVSDDDVTA